MNALETTIVEHSFLNTMRREHVDPNRLISDMVPLLHHALGPQVEIVPVTTATWPIDIDATQLEAAVLNLAMPHCTSHYQTVTVSVGVACAKPNDKQQPGDLIEAADAALYAAKHRGRNAVVEHGVVRLTDGAIALAS